MADLTNSKPGPGAIYPRDAVESVWSDVEPLIDPGKLVRLHLFGIPLVSAIALKGRPPQVMTHEDVKEFILEAVGLAEAEVGIEIFPRQHVEAHPYDQPAQNSFGHLVVRHRPVSQIQNLSVVSSDGINVYTVPNAWIATGYLPAGQINLFPFAVAAQSGVTIPLTSPAGTGLLPALFRFTWVPSLWNVTYTTGYKDGLVPRMVNQLIGTIAAMEILSVLAATHSRTTSASIGMDGISQSTSGPGPTLFQQRMEELASKRRWIIAKLKRVLALGIWSDNI